MCHVILINQSKTAFEKTASCERSQPLQQAEEKSSLDLISTLINVLTQQEERENRRRVKTCVHNDDRDLLSSSSTSAVLSWSESDNVFLFKSQQRLWSETHISASERSRLLLKLEEDESGRVWILCDMLWTQQSKTYFCYSAGWAALCWKSSNNHNHSICKEIQQII